MLRRMPRFDPLTEPRRPAPIAARASVAHRALAVGRSGAVGSSYWLRLLLLLGATRGAWLLADHTPMLFLGDSASYLHTAITGWIPPDRSFTYGLVIRASALWPGTLTTLLALQAACGVVAGLLLAVAILETVGRRPILAATLAVAWTALEPLALLWERYVMAEACALAAFATTVVAGLVYVRTHRLRWLLAAHVAAVAVLSLRLPFVGSAWLATLALPLLATAGRLPVRRVLAHVGVSLAVVVALHLGYQALYARLTDGPMGYQHADGEFLLSAWSPLVRAEDFDDPTLGRRLLETSRCDVRDSRAREGQRWNEGCLVALLEGATGDALAANELAGRAARNLAVRDPLGVARLALRSWLDYFDRAYVSLTMRWDRRETDYDPVALAMLATHFALDGRPLPHLATPTNRLYYAAAAWIPLLAESPALAWLALLAAGSRERWRHARQGAWIALLASAAVGVTALASMSPTPRFLHPLGWLAPLWMAQLASSVLPRPAGRAVERAVHDALGSARCAR